MKTSLYNQDGSLHPEAQLLISLKPDGVSRKEWIKRLKDFRSQLSTEDLKEFEKLRKKEADARWRAKNPEKAKQGSANWRAKNPEKAKQGSANWRAKNPDYSANRRAENPKKIKQNNKNPEKARKYAALYYALHSKKINKLTTQRQNRRYKEDPLYRLKKVMRTQCHKTVKCLALGKKPLQTFEWVGCSPEELKAHLESLFTEGMSWENYGEWHVDHIRPISSFSLTEWKQVNHYTNLQPLWAEDNLKKGDKWEVDLSTKNLDGMQTVEGVESRAPKTTQDELLVTQKE